MTLSTMLEKTVLKLLWKHKKYQIAKACKRALSECIIIPDLKLYSSYILTKEHVTGSKIDR